MASEKKPPPSLLDAEARGGDTAEGGFTFQDHMLVARIPAWLRREGFSEMVREAMGDAEAKFFVPGLGEVREFVEYKDHRVAPAEFWKEVGHLRKLDEGAPDTYARFVLGCRGVSESVRPVLNALRRVRDPHTFYAGADEIRDASFEDFVGAVERAGHSRADAEFLFSKVSVESDAPDAERLAREVFSASLKEHFPGTSRLAGGDVEAAFEGLRSLVKSRRNQPISRAELESTLWSRVPEEIRADRRPVRVITATDSVDPASAQELVFDWQEFFGGGERRYPPPGAWNRMRKELQAASEWIAAARRPRRISLGGSRRLSASLCIGSVFSAVSGFTFEMDYRGEVWKTDKYGGPEYPWEVERVGPRQCREIAVAIGILKDIREDVAQFLEHEGRSAELRLVLTGFEALTGPAAANAAAAAAKEAVARELSASGARVLHLFMAVPAPFALYLGHRLNAVGEVQCYEWVGESSYVPTCRFST